MTTIQYVTQSFLSSGIFGILAIFIGFIAGSASLVILILKTSQRMRRFAVASGLLPVLIGFVGTLIGYALSHDSFAASHPSEADMTGWIMEVLSPTIVGACVTVFLLVVLGSLYVGTRRNHLSQPVLPSN